MTCGLVTGLAAVFAVVGWEQADRVASVVSALTSVGALGVGVWVLLPRSVPETREHPRPEAGPAGAGTTATVRTGTATANGPGSRANTGVIGTPPTPGPMIASGTGDAHATGGGIANSGIAGVDRQRHA